MDANTFNLGQLYGVMASDTIGATGLAELALDLRWSWNHEADSIWQELDAELWRLTHNPWTILQTVSQQRLDELLTRPGFREQVDRLLALKKSALGNPAWFQQHYGSSSLSLVAYFSMEFMLSEALPIYVGGLGNVAGDQLKAASDLGVPVAGIGLFYQQGYFRQQLSSDGDQQAFFPYNDPGQLPVIPLRLSNGEWLRLRLRLGGQDIWLRTWQVQTGRNCLYLLDSNDPANTPGQRSITNELYGGGAEQRIQQEIILGIGGWALLKKLGLKPQICHLNEGHAAFAVLARAADYMKTNSCSFREAWMICRPGNLFTTHTAVDAGFDRFEPDLIRRFFSEYAATVLQINVEDLLALGRTYPANLSESFNMANLAIRGSGAINGVSKLHGEVSRSLFSSLFRRWPLSEIPVGSVTNGVHMPSWDSALADELWTSVCGKERWRGDLDQIREQIAQIPDKVLWEFRQRSRAKLVDDIRQAYERQRRMAGDPEPAGTAFSFNPQILTLGFARRFVPYKRPNLLLSDEQRLVRLLTNPERPVQLVIAGKAPPFDESGKALIRDWIRFIERNNLHRHIVFLADYDMLLAEQLVQGVDVWLNMPRRPWEACGTSGMKVLVNGGVNLSELDGWWAEAYTPDVGWAIGDRLEYANSSAHDESEARSLFELLEQQVVPEFYNRDQNQVPLAWTRRMRNSMAMLTPVFSANRTVREYTEKYYLPGAAAYLSRAADQSLVGISLYQRTAHLREQWPGLRIEQVEYTVGADGYYCSARLYLNGISDTAVAVQLYAESLGSLPVDILRLNVVPAADDVGDERLFEISFRSARQLTDYTLRVIPVIDGLSVPLELELITWEH